MRDIIFFILFLVIAGAIAYGFDAVFSALLPQSSSGLFIKPYSIGIRPLGISCSICGVLGIIIALALIKFVKR